MDSSAISHSWDLEYESGRYAGEGPVKFVDKIIEYGPTGTGLYVGCGNGRNYLPLVRAGLDIVGIDASGAAISQLQAKAKNVRRMNFLDVSGTFDYVVSIQSFQHGKLETVLRYFDKAAQILRDGGLVFLRVNSASTVPWHSHRVTERGDHGGFTALYLDGPKRGLEVHFFTKGEICSITADTMDVLYAPQTSHRRPRPQSGTWHQIEMIMRKTGRIH